jgi:thiol:disulfide interchange protein
VGVPLAVFYPTGKGSEPVVLPELLTEKIVLDTLSK